MFRIARGVLQDQRGATALEYAILAGLIALGIVGSLVTTRGSLRSTFNTAGSQMSAAATPAPDQAASARTSYWQAKGAPATTVSGNSTLYQFPDGTQMAMTKRYNGDGSFAGETLTETGKIYDVNGKAIYKTDASGAMTDYYYEEYYSGTSQKDLQFTTSAAKNWVIDGIGYNPDGSVGYTTHPTLSAANIAQANQDALYFRTLSAQ